MINITVSKVIDELEGLEDVLMSPRSYSTENLRKACMNLSFKCDEALDAIEAAAVYFLIREFFYLAHQNGLYNAQKPLWSLIARTRRIILKPVKKPFWAAKDNVKMTDIEMIDDTTNKTATVRVVHPYSPEDTKDEAPGFNDLISNVSGKSVGLFYLSPNPLPVKIQEKVVSKTNASDPIDRYRSPISKNASLNIIQYSELREKAEFEFDLVHPNLGRKVSSKIDLENPQMKPAELVENKAST